jgi:ceramide glucosyltransferase
MRRVNEVVVVGIVLTILAAGYALLALVAVLAWRPRPAHAGRRPVSVLKPLYGAEPRLYENLRSFCVQDYADYQLIFGVREASDPAVAVVQRLQHEFPARDIVLVVDGRLHGSNYKVSNLINIAARARHEWLVLADSDIQVDPDYLGRLAAPLADATVGIVTCLYRGHPIGGLWSRLGALFIDDWFAPSVLVSHLFGSRDFAFGASIALSRRALEAIGGFHAVADQLADDWWLGEMTRRKGLRTVLSDCIVATDVIEAGPRALIDHELRWLRTIRTIQPLGYFFSVVTIGLPLAVLGLLLAPASPLAWAGLTVTAGGRLVVHLAQRIRGRKSLFSDVWLLPLRDFLTFGLWIASFASRRVRWGAQRFSVGQEGNFKEIA